jgi:hypothetical protein
MAFANRWFSLAFACVGLGACAASSRPVQSVAQYDLSCARVEVTRVDDDHYAAAGCGRGAVYVQQCEGGECRWARLRHGHEVDVAAAQVPLVGTPAPQREVLPAPAPAGREVLPAPPPGSREVLPAPPPEATSGGETSPDAATQPLENSSLSDPYQTEVPAVPAAQRTTYPPPAPLVETRPAAPSVTYVWVGGYWWWGDWGWTWVPGYWAPPRPGFVWVGGGWYWYSSWWWYYPGGWCYPGTRVVAYAPAPRPQRVVTVRTIRPHAEARRPAVATHSPTRAPVRTIEPARSAASPSQFTPQRPPLLRYPGTSSAGRERLLASPQRAPSGYSVAPATGGSRAGASLRASPPSSSHGRLVKPGSTVPPRSTLSPRSSSAPSASRFDRTPQVKSAAPRSRPPSTVSPRAPSRSAPSSLRPPSGGSSPRVVRPR